MNEQVDDLDKLAFCDVIEDDVSFEAIETIGAGEEPENSVIIIDSRNFLRECMRRSVQSVLTIPVITMATISELESKRHRELIRLILLSIVEGNSAESVQALRVLSALAPNAPIVVLTSERDFETMRAVISYGARGYIPMTMGFEIAIEAVRFVLAGGTYVPAEGVLSVVPSLTPPALRAAASGAITTREAAVIRAIHQGKPNKTIAYELNMCESTVKVHVRHIMKKMRAKNRTDVAIKATHLLSCSKCMGQNQCWSLGRCLRKSA
jgi:DNA-binding NarL/FixJ family response regulator